MKGYATKVIGAHRLKTLYLYYQRFFADWVFIHITKCGGTSIERALGIPLKVHRTAVEHRRIFGEARWRGVFSFALVRNPFARVVSAYTYRLAGPPNRRRRLEGIEFNDWVRVTFGERDPRYYDVPLMLAPCVEWITDEDGHVIVNSVGRLETIDQDWPVICAKIGRLDAAPLPRLNASAAPNYRDVFSAEARRIVERHFEPDLEMFKYRF